MNKKYISNRMLSFLISLMVIFSLYIFPMEGISQVKKQLTPIMGWSSWNNFRININEDIIRRQADFMARPAMREAGYRFINIDDGYFGGRDKEGNIKSNPKKFPSGMKALADYIHSKGLKAGIYSDAGINTCASTWDKDTLGSGMGLYGHEQQDLTLMLREWGYDFIKVDWCGGERLGLNEQQQYTHIGNIIRSLKEDVVYNVCRWQFPGNWVTQIADSWRVSGDIANKFSSVLHIIDLNAELWRNAGPGHVNDMDMLQVGRGMTYDEDKTHFSMWSMMCSPLLLGNDLTKMSDSTLQIITNKEIIALNQDPLVYQARRIRKDNDVQVWAKPLITTMSGEVAVALLNTSEILKNVELDVSQLGIDVKKGYSYRDLWKKQNYAYTTNSTLNFDVAPHGVVVIRIKGTAVPFNIFQSGR